MIKTFNTHSEVDVPPNFSPLFIGEMWIDSVDIFVNVQTVIFVEDHENQYKTSIHILWPVVHVQSSCENSTINKHFLLRVYFDSASL